MIKSGDNFFEFANDKGIASIYLLLSEIFPFWVTADMIFMAFIFNCITLIGCYWIYGKISDEFNFGFIGRLSFFINLRFLYFAQLINKDMLTIFIFLLSTYAGLRNRHWYLLLLIPFVVFIRIQLVIFILIFVLFSSSNKIKMRFLIVYVVTSVLAGYLSVYFPIIGEDSLGDGFSAYVVDLNQKYFIGYLFLNPIRVIQYIFDAYLSFYFFTESGAVDVAKILRLPQLILLITLTPCFYKLFFYWERFPKIFIKPLTMVVLAYACTWLMNPTVNARYVMLITPILVLLGLYVRRTRRCGRF